MRWSLVLIGLAGCHLAETPEGAKCGDGMHIDNGACVYDIADGPIITIAAAGEAGSCTTSPASITVAPNGNFKFQNDDTVDHVISGADGQVWATAVAKKASPFIGITKAGSWPFKVSGCTGGGTVVVQ